MEETLSLLKEQSFKLKEITPRSWFMHTDYNSNIGIMSENNKKEIVLVTDGAKASFTSRDKVCEYFGRNIFDSIVQFEIKEKNSFINGYPTDCENAAPLTDSVTEDIESQYTNYPLYTKGETKNSIHCAGYYVLHCPKGPLKAFCPKLKTIMKYRTEGPFATDLEMKTVYSQLKRKFQLDNTK